MKKINILLLVGGVIILIASGWLIFSNKGVELIPREGTKIPQVGVKQEVVLVIDDGEGEPKTFQGAFGGKMTAFDLLKDKTEELGLSLETKTYEIGILIEAIGDKENGQDEKYWIYYINGEMPMVSADKKEIKPGDKIEFKFGKTPF